MQSYPAAMIILQVYVMILWTSLFGSRSSLCAVAAETSDYFQYLQEQDYELNLTREWSKVFIARFGEHPHYDELAAALNLTRRYVVDRRTWIRNATASGYFIEDAPPEARWRELRDAEVVLVSLEDINSLNSVLFSENVNSGLNYKRYLAKMYKQWFLLTGNLSIGLMAIKSMDHLLHDLKSKNYSEDLPPELNKTINEKAVLQDMFALTLLRVSLYKKLVQAEESYGEYVESLDHASGLAAFDAVAEFLHGVKEERKRIWSLWQTHGEILDYYSAFPWAGANLSLEKLDNITSQIRDEFSERRKSFNDNTLRRYFISPFLSCIISLTGVVWNGVLLFAFARAPELRKAPNTMIFNITVVDVLAVANVPIAYVYWFHRKTLGLSVGTCRSYLQFRDLLVAVGEVSVVALGIQRFMATTTIMQNEDAVLGTLLRIPSAFRLAFYVLSVWLLACILHLLPLIVGGHYPEKSCFYVVPDKRLRDAVNTLRFVLQVAILPAVMFLLSILTARRLRRSAKEMPGNGGCQQRIARYRSARVVTALACVFALSYVPRYIFIFLYLRLGLDLSNRTVAWVHHVVYFLSFSNSCFNPIALYFASGTFRKNFNKYLFCWCKWRKLSKRKINSDCSHPAGFALTSASSITSIRHSDPLS